MPSSPAPLSQAFAMPNFGSQCSDSPKHVGPKNRHGAQSSLPFPLAYHISDLAGQAMRTRLLERSSAIPRISKALFALPLLLCLGIRYLTERNGMLNVISGADMRLTCEIKRSSTYTTYTSYPTRLSSFRLYHLPLNFTPSES